MHKITRFTKSLLTFTLSVALSQGAWAQDKPLLNSDKVSPVEIASQEAPITPTQQVEKLSYDAQNKKLSSEKRIDALRELANYPSQNSLAGFGTAIVPDFSLDPRLTLSREITPLPSFPNTDFGYIVRQNQVLSKAAKQLLTWVGENVSVVGE